MENGWTEHIEALVSANAAMRDNVAQKQILIEKLVDENARLRESFDKLKQEVENERTIVAGM